MFLNNSNFMALTNNLVKLGSQLALSNERISTAKRVNRASDDPAGIVSINNLKSQIAQIEAMGSNAQRINSSLDSADAGIAGISELLKTIDSAILNAAGNPSNRSVYQGQIDSAISAIDNLVSASSFGGQKLIDGSRSYSVTNNSSDKIADIRIDSSSSMASTTITISASGASIAEEASDGFAVLTEDATIEITGPDGTETLNFLTGATRADVQAGIDAVSGNTGVIAVNEGGAITFKTADAGADQAITINITAGSDITFAGQSSTSFTGSDANITVDGRAVTIDNDSKTIKISSNGVSGVISLKDGFYDTVAGSTATFTVSGDGAGFAMGIGTSNRIDLGINNMSSSALGSFNMGYLSSLKSGGENDLASGNLSKAANIVTASQSQVNTARGKIGAIQNYAVDAVMNSFEKTKISLAQSLSNIEDTDMVAELAKNERLVLLQEMTISVLSRMTESAKSIYSLLRS